MKQSHQDNFETFAASRRPAMSARTRAELGANGRTIKRDARDLGRIRLNFEGRGKRLVAKFAPKN